MPKVIFALNAHTTRVNSVQWLCSNTIVSIGGDEKLIVVWKCSGNARDPESWKAFQMISEEKSGHKNTLTHLKAFNVSAKE